MNRNEFLRCCAGAIGGMMFTGCSQGTRRPKIILLLVDDMGWQDTSVPFHAQRTLWNDLYHTPNMQRLADRGKKFTNAYAASPVCSPTRVSMMTGKNPARTNITDWVGHGIYGNSYVEAPNWATDGLQPGQERTLPEILRENGYRTIHIGKGSLRWKRYPRRRSHQPGVRHKHWRQPPWQSGRLVFFTLGSLS